MTTEPQVTPTTDAELVKELIGDDGQALDELGEKVTAFKALIRNDPQAADSVLEQLDLEGQVETDIVRQVANPTPIANVAAFPPASREFAKSLEVLKRNGYRPGTPARRLPVLTPLLITGVQLVARFIVENHLRNLTTQVSNLYTRREAWALPRSEEARLLRRARIDLDRMVGGMTKDSPFGLPTFLLGGAAVSTVLAGVASAARTVASNNWLIVLSGLGLLLLFLGGAWTVLRGAAVSRKRIKISTDLPARQLYTVLGGCGDPPRDQAVVFALIAMVLMAVAWILVPAALIWVGTRLAL